MKNAMNTAPAAKARPEAPATGADALDRRVSVAPMMGWTDKHDRYFLRLISPNALLYTVMITTGALIYGKKTEILEFNPEEHPVALQLGGSDPKDLGTCAKMAEDYGYDEVNLNCGCPSDRVQRGQRVTDAEIRPHRSFAGKTVDMTEPPEAFAHGGESRPRGKRAGLSVSGYPGSSRDTFTIF